MNIYTILFLVVFIILCVVMTNLTLRLNNKQRNKLNEIKLNLEKNCGIKFNHSYKLIRKKDKSIRYLRVFSIHLLNKEVKVECYFTTKNGEIGVGYDKIEFLYGIKDNYELEDCGEWTV